MELKITYEIKGKERRELAQAISETLNIASIYKGVPIPRKGTGYHPNFVEILHRSHNYTYTISVLIH